MNKSNMHIRNYDDFVEALLESGFAMGGSNGGGIFSLITWDWKETPPYDTPVRWHTGDQVTDPWEWRMRVLNERDDIAYAKVFFGRSGYITKEWYPYFLAARRCGRDFDEAYADGTISHFSKRVYDVIREAGVVPFHTIKQLGGFAHEDNSRFERALVDLQMKLYITMCGVSQKISHTGREYGWSSTVFTTSERFWKSSGVFEQASSINKHEAIEAITDRIFELNPDADQKKIEKFIRG